MTGIVLFPVDHEWELGLCGDRGGYCVWLCVLL